MSGDYRVQLDVFSGPLDLLLYLVRRDEVDIQDIQIARLTEQYLEYMRLLEQVDPNMAGDFLVMASTLLELKSRALLPSPPAEPLEEEDDPRGMLVRQLLEYKRVKDAARALADAADERRKRFPRRPADMAEHAGVEMEEAEVWDLLAAFGRVMTAVGAGPSVHEVRFDETPIEEYEGYIIELVARGTPLRFQSLFYDKRNRAEIIGMFLALLELVRNRKLRAEQDVLHGEIYLFPVAPPREGAAPVEPAEDDAPLLAPSEAEFEQEQAPEVDDG